MLEDFRENQFYLKSDGMPEDPAEVSAYQEGSARYARAVEDHKRKDNPELFENIAETMGQINFETIRDIMARIAEKSRINNPNILKATHVFFDLNSVMSAGTYVPIENMVHLALPSSENAQESGPKLFNKRDLLHLINHEFSHALSRNQTLGFQELKRLESFGPFDSLTDAQKAHRQELRERSGSNSGFSSENRISGSVFTDLNEGVTETLARQITQEYLEREPEFAQDLPPGETRVYDLQVQLVKSLTRKIAENTGQSNEAVWNAIVRSYLEGFEDTGTTLSETLAEVLPADFLKKLETGGRYSLQEIIDHLDGNIRKIDVPMMSPPPVKKLKPLRPKL